MDGTRRLPRGIALVRIQTPFGKIVVCSEHLTESEAQVARVLASVKVRDGARAVVLTEMDLVAVLSDAA